MPLFTSEKVNRLDKKGRISVPADFREELLGSSFPGIVVFPHPEIDCIECWDRERMERYAEGMDEYPPMSAEYAAISSIMTKAKKLSFDPEGRVSIPPAMLEACGITEEIKFAGRGQTFQLWDPAAFDRYEAETASQARSGSGGVHLAPRPVRPRDGG